MIFLFLRKWVSCNDRPLRDDDRIKAASRDQNGSSGIRSTIFSSAIPQESVLSDKPLRDDISVQCGF